MKISAKSFQLHSSSDSKLFPLVRSSESEGETGNMNLLKQRLNHIKHPLCFNGFYNMLMHQQMNIHSSKHPRHSIHLHRFNPNLITCLAADL